MDQATTATGTSAEPMTAGNEELMRQARAERDTLLKDARDIRDREISEAKAKAKAEADEPNRNGSGAVLVVSVVNQGNAYRRILRDVGGS